jgi:tetratricopeptide (TPR) repeat protein
VIKRGFSLLAFAIVAGASGTAWAGPDESASTAQSEVQAADRESGSVLAIVQQTQSQLVTVEQRLANGEILYRTALATSKDDPLQAPRRQGDLARAQLVFSEIIEGFPDTRSAADATWLRGETYYESEEYLAARRDYRTIVDKANDPRFQPFVGRAVARLVDVSIRLQDFASLDEVFQKMNQVPPSQVDAALTYARGKAYYFKKDYANANQAFSSVTAGSLYGHQARYFQGLVRMREAKPETGPAGEPKPANYRSAIEAFRSVTDLPPDTPEHRHVIDLSWMAMGRLFYEMEQYQQAVEAYNRVGRDSPEFDTMLYELAWTFVRLGDVQRAERALEVLAIADPESSYVGDGTLLRADLLLRAGAFDKALELYLKIRDQFEPTRVKLETFLANTQDVAVFYDKISQQQLDTLDQNDQLPPITLKWAREMEDGPAAFRIIDDINECKHLIRASELLVEKLMIVVNSPSRVRAFPELKAGQQQAVGLLNRIARARLELAKGMDSSEPGSLSGEIDSVRNQRRQLMGTVGQMPVLSAEFEQRDANGMKQWNNVSQDLSRRMLEIESLNATVNGLRRMLREDAQRGVTRDAASVQRFQTEIDANERQLKLFRDQAGELRRQIEIGRSQVGLGDSRYQNDATARANFRDAFDREVQLAQSGAAGGDAQRYASRIWPILQTSRTVEDRLTSSFSELERQVEGRVAELKGKIDAERSKMVGYQGELQKLDGEARDLVGRVAQRNFMLVRDKVRGIVLRADVGITEQAWEVREEELERVRSLQTERARQEQILDEELREVLDDSGEPGK